MAPGTLFTIAMRPGTIPGVYRLEIQTIMADSGSLSVSGSDQRESTRVAFDYFKANAGLGSAALKVAAQDFHLHLAELQHTGSPEALTLPSKRILLPMCSVTDTPRYLVNSSPSSIPASSRVLWMRFSARLG